MATSARPAPAPPPGPSQAPAPVPAGRPARARRLRAAAAVAFVLGTLLVAEGLATVVWQEPLTALVAARHQHQLRGRLHRLMAAPLPPATRARLAALPDDRARLRALARRLRRATPTGDAVGRLRIARTGTDLVLVKGDAPADLRRGPGVFDGSPFPGEPGTVAIAGHRTTYLAPFRHLDRLRPGDLITVDMPYARLRYRVTGRRIVAPDAVGVVRRVAHDRLVLTACHPLLSAAQRIVVFAVPVDARLRAPGRGLSAMVLRPSVRAPAAAAPGTRR